VNLIEDVKRRTEKKKNIILVVTGDIIDKGQYGNSRSGGKRTAIDFFRRLNDALTDTITYETTAGMQKRWKSRRVVDVQIVAGNHDKDLSDKYAVDISERYQHQPFDGDRAQWEFEKPYFESFIALTNEIYNVFGLKKEITRGCNSRKQYSCKLSSQPKSISDTFGVEFIEVPCLGIQTDKFNSKPSENLPNSCCSRCRQKNEPDKRPDVTLAFIRLNTAFISNGKPEHHLMSLGRHQLKSLCDEYQEQYSKRSDRSEHIITICLAHHPMLFLKPHEEDKLREYLLDKDYLNADFYVCGHTHERMVSSLSSKGRTVGTLVTGIGWGHEVTETENEVRAAQKDTHSYSIYTFNEEKNILSTKMLKTNTSGEFEDDTSYYTTRTQQRLNKISSPLYLSDYPFIELNGQEDAVNELFVDRQILGQIREMYDNKAKFIDAIENALKRIVLQLCRDHMDTPRHLDETREEMVRAIQNFTLDQLNSGSYSHFLFSPQIDKIIESIIDSKNKVLANTGKDSVYQFAIFKSFLESLATIFIDVFEGAFTNDVVRLIIRHHDGTVNNEYVPFFEIPLPESPEQMVNRRYKWGNLKQKYITAEAFESKSSKIFTLNKDLVDFPVKNWEDFIVMVPDVDVLKYTRREANTKAVTFPVLSFVFSVRLDENAIADRSLLERKVAFKELSNKLYLLEYIKIYEAIELSIDKFLQLIKIEGNEFVDYLAKRNNLIAPSG